VSTCVRLRSPSTQPVNHAVRATLGVETSGVALGARCWPHYLTQMIPMIDDATRFRPGARC